MFTVHIAISALTQFDVNMASWFSLNLEAVQAQVTAAAAAAQERVTKLAQDVQTNVQHLGDNLSHLDIHVRQQTITRALLQSLRPAMHPGWTLPWGDTCTLQR